MIDARSEDNKFFKMICMKELDYVMNVMLSWVILDDLKGERTRRYRIYSSGMK